VMAEKQTQSLKPRSTGMGAFQKNDHVMQ
jgi:hypothetical protein